MKRITSAHNEPLKHLTRLLSQARARREHGQTVLEGVHLVQTCLQHGLMPQQVYLPESRLHQPEIQALLAQLPEHLITLAANEALAKITSLSEGEDVMALLAIPEAGALPVGGDCVVLERVQDPGNVGTLARTLYALGGAGLITPRHNGVYLGAGARRAAAGALEHLPVARVTNLARALEDAAEQGYAIYAAEGAANSGNSGNSENPADSDNSNSSSSSKKSKTPEASASAFTDPLTLPAVLVLGSEEHGLRPLVRKHCDRAIHIPMLRDFNSLNVAQAGGILIASFLRRRLETA